MLSFSGPGSGGAEAGAAAGDEEEEADVSDEVNSPLYLSRSCAFFNVSTLETHQRLGILARFLQWPVGFRLISLRVKKKKKKKIVELGRGEWKWCITRPFFTRRKEEGNQIASSLPLQ